MGKRKWLKLLCVGKSLLGEHACAKTHSNAPTINRVQSFGSILPLARRPVVIPPSAPWLCQSLFSWFRHSSFDWPLSRSRFSECLFAYTPSFSIDVNKIAPAYPPFVSYLLTADIVEIRIWLFALWVANRSCSFATVVTSFSVSGVDSSCERRCLVTSFISFGFRTLLACYVYVLKLCIKISCVPTP